MPPIRRISQVVGHLSTGGAAHGQTAPGDYTGSGHALSGDATVAVTGAAGYVGGWLVKYCLERGYFVRACVRDVDAPKAAFLKNMHGFGSKLTLHAADMTQEHAYDAIFEGCHTVFHPAEVFMSAGREDGWARQSGQKINMEMLHTNAMESSQFIVDSINRSSTTKRLIYTASIASMMPSRGMEGYADDPIIDEQREPHADTAGANSCALPFLGLHAPPSH